MKKSSFDYPKKFKIENDVNIIAVIFDFVYNKKKIFNTYVPIRKKMKTMIK
jgi:hypothetical protein